MLGSLCKKMTKGSPNDPCSHDSVEVQGEGWWVALHPGARPEEGERGYSWGQRSWVWEEELLAESEQTAGCNEEKWEISHLTFSQSIGRHVGVLSFFKWDSLEMGAHPASLRDVTGKGFSCNYSPCFQKAFPYCWVASLCWVQLFQWSQEVLAGFPEGRATSRSRRDGLYYRKGKQNWMHILLLLVFAHAQRTGPLPGSGFLPCCWDPLISHAHSHLCLPRSQGPNPFPDFSWKKAIYKSPPFCPLSLAACWLNGVFPEEPLLSFTE